MRTNSKCPRNNGLVLTNIERHTHIHTQQNMSENNNHCRYTHTLRSTCLDSSVITQVKVEDTTLVVNMSNTNLLTISVCVRERETWLAYYRPDLSLQLSPPPSIALISLVCPTASWHVFFIPITPSWTTIWTLIPVLRRVDTAVVNVGFACVNVVATMKGAQRDTDGHRDVIYNI